MFPTSYVSNDTVKRNRHQCIISRKVDAKNPWNARQTNTLIYGNQGDESRHVASHSRLPHPVVGTLREPVSPAPLEAPHRTRTTLPPAALAGPFIHIAIPAEARIQRGVPRQPHPGPPLLQWVNDTFGLPIALFYRAVVDLLVDDEEQGEETAAELSGNTLTLT